MAPGRDFDVVVHLHPLLRIQSEHRVDVVVDVGEVVADSPGIVVAVWNRALAADEYFKVEYSFDGGDTWVLAGISEALCKS